LQEPNALYTQQRRKRMPGKQVKNWKQYHALREKGHSKESAARIVNAQASKPKRKRRKK
jgi:hypothetical protein